MSTIPIGRADFLSASAASTEEYSSPNAGPGTLPLNRAQYRSDVIPLGVLWRLRYKLGLRDLAEMFLIRDFVFSYGAVRDWDARLTPALAEDF